MAGKLTLVCFLLFVALDLARPSCDFPGAAPSCDALCWIMLPNFDDIDYRYGCLDSEGSCWCCDPRLTTTTQTSSYGAYGGYVGYNRLSYTCPDPSDLGCNNGQNCHFFNWYEQCAG